MQDNIIQWCNVSKTYYNNDEFIDGSGTMKKPNKKTVKKTGVHFQAKYLTVLKKFIAVDDVRYYLNGFHVRPHPEKDGVLITGTNGHYMCMIYDKTGFADREYIYPLENGVLKAAKELKFEPKIFIKDDVVHVVKSFEKGANFESSLADLTPKKHTLFCGHAEEIDGNYPDVARVIPDLTNSTPLKNVSTFNVNYLAAISAMANCRLDNKAFVSATIGMNGENNSMLAVGGEENEIMLVIMPTRDSREIYQDWIPTKSRDLFECWGWGVTIKTSIKHINSVARANKTRKPTIASSTMPINHLFVNDSGSNKGKFRMACQSYYEYKQGDMTAKISDRNPPKRPTTIGGDVPCSKCLKAFEKLNKKTEIIKRPTIEKLKGLKNEA